MLLKINCGRNEGIQTIHIDRVRKVRDQTLLGESERQETSGPSQHTEAQAEFPESPNEQAVLSEADEPFVETRSKRVVRKPRWLRDYQSVFSICRDNACD